MSTLLKGLLLSNLTIEYYPADSGRLNMVQA